MSLPCSDQDERPVKMKDATLPPGVEHLRCWCGNLGKVKEVIDFSDRLGMKFFMCPNYEHDPPVPLSPYVKPPSPPPLCMWYRWIDKEMPDWAVEEINTRSRRAWQRFHAEERAEKAAAQAKAEEEKELKEHREEQRRFWREVGRKKGEEEQRMLEEERRRKEAREAERERKRERAAVAKAAEDRGDKTGKWPQWTQ